MKRSVDGHVNKVKEVRLHMYLPSRYSSSSTVGVRVRPANGFNR